MGRNPLPERVRLAGDVPPRSTRHRLPVPHPLLEAQGVCRTVPLPLEKLAPGHHVACHFAENTPAA